MSVRITERLIGDVVVASKLPNSAKMVVQAIDEEAKLATTIWFSDDHAVQVGEFPASALDRADQKGTAGEKKVAAKKPAAKKPGRKR